MGSRRTRALTCFFLLSSLGGPSVEGQTTALRFGRLLDGSGAVVRDAVVLVDGDRITAAGPRASVRIPPGARIIDLSRFTALPGLVDVHVHMTYYWDGKPGTQPWSQLGRRPPPMTLYLAQANARRTLESGVTTVRDLHASNQLAMHMRDLIADGAMVGPRMVTAGCGLGRRQRAGGCGAHTGGIDDVVRAAKEQIASGAEWIKIFGSTGSASDLSGHPTHSYDEMKIVVDSAKAAGKRVAIHSYGPGAARDAVRAGANSLEHAVDLDDATIAEMVKAGTFYVPTIDHNRYYAEHRDEYGYTTEMADSLHAFVLRNVATLRRAHRAGVRVAMGSDAVFTGFGQNARELEWFVEAGMTNADAIAAATANGAALLGMDETIGRIAPGFFADLIAVAGDPLTDIRTLTRGVRWVMKGGAVVVDRGR
jgi:imidazolonepropionase-like amidohydrolase